jgi:hypothetical protein
VRAGRASSRQFSVPALPLIRAVVDGPMQQGLQHAEVAPIVQALARAYLARARFQRLLRHSIAFRALVGTFACPRHILPHGGGSLKPRRRRGGLGLADRVGHEEAGVVRAITRLQAVWRGRRDRTSYRRKRTCSPPSPSPCSCQVSLPNAPADASRWLCRAPNDHRAGDSNDGADLRLSSGYADAGAFCVHLFLPLRRHEKGARVVLIGKGNRCITSPCSTWARQTTRG